MKFKMFVTDVDDTLLNDNHEITERNKEAIMDMQRQGVTFVLASGRPTEAITNIAKELELDKYNGYIAGYNGGEILDVKSGEIISRDKLTREELLGIYEETKDIDLKFITYKNKSILGKENDEYVNEEVRLTGFDFIEFYDLKDVEFDEVIKCMLVGNSKIVSETREILEPRYKGKYYVTISKPIFLEITNKNISKGNAVKKISEKLGISLEEVAAIGDSFNDVSMLEIAGFSATVENGNPEIKKMVKFISSSNNEDGIANFVEEMKK